MTIQNCREFEERLQNRVEQRQPVDAALKDHAGSCSSCETLLQDHRLLEAAVADWRTRIPEADLEEAVLAAWRAETAVVAPAREPVPSSIGPVRQRQRSGSRFAVLATVVTALAIIAVALMTVDGDRNDPQTANHDKSPAPNVTITRKSNPAPHVPEQADPVDMKQLLTGFQTQFTGVKQDVTDLASAVRGGFPDVSMMLWNNGEQAPVKKSTTPMNEKKPGWQSSLDPLQRDVRKAFGFLKDALPKTDPST